MLVDMSPMAKWSVMRLQVWMRKGKGQQSKEQLVVSKSQRRTTGQKLEVREQSSGAMCGWPR